MNFIVLFASFVSVNAIFIIIEIILHLVVILFVVNPNQEKERQQIIALVKMSHLGRWVSAIHPFAFWWLRAYRWFVAFWEL